MIFWIAYATKNIASSNPAIFKRVSIHSSICGLSPFLRILTTLYHMYNMHVKCIFIHFIPIRALQRTELGAMHDRR